jgi:hypothetical protein
MFLFKAHSAYILMEITLCALPYYFYNTNVPRCKEKWTPGHLAK